MGTGRITNPREVERGGVRHSVASAKPTLDTSGFLKTVSLWGDVMKMRGKLMLSYADNVATLAKALGGAFEEYGKYEDRLAEVETLKQKEAELTEANVCRTADGKPVIDPGDVCTRHDHDPFRNAFGNMDETPYAAMSGGH